MNEGRFKRESVCNGLNDEQVIESRVRNGSNQFTEKRTRGFFGRLISELGDPIIRILLIALAVTLMIPSGEGGNFDAIGIGVAVALATFVSTLCEYGSEKAFRRMQREAGSRRCCVMRNGKKRELNVGELVVGDIVFLKAGDFVPADGRLISGTLSCDLSALNGESAEQRKIADDDFVGSSFNKVSERGEDLLGDKHSLFRGSELTAGEGVMIVTAVGDHTYYGRMATELQEDVGDSPLKIKLKNLAVTLSKIGYFCAIVVGVSDLAFNTILDPRFVFTFPGVAKSLAHAVTLGVSVVVMAVPEGLPMMITVVLASNMLRMQKAHVMVRKLVGIETAGSINVLFTDKTGTLTYGKPKISGFVYSDGYAERMDGLPKHIYELMTVAATQAVGCDIEYSNGVATAIGGEITDRAFTDAAILCGTARRIGERLAFFPFNSRDKLCAATVKASFGSEERELTLIKGAPEILLGMCEYCYSADGSRRKIDKNAIESRLESMTSMGMRVMAVISSECGAESLRCQAEIALSGECANISELINDGCFISLVCISDRIREEAKDAISLLRSAGIQTVMITGDNRRTAESIAREVGILRRGEMSDGAVLSGSEIASMSDRELERIIPRLKVVARALPQDKSRLVRIAKGLSMVVGMTGDGLNDAPALKQADVGFAMGSGTDMAKEAGDIIITDNNISSIASAVLYGRTIFKSIRKFIVFQLTMNLCAVGISLIGPFIGYESPVSVLQMLWINIIIDTLAALAFAGEAPLEEYMKESPVPKREPVLSREMIGKIVALGSYTLGMCVYFLTSPSVAMRFSASMGDERILTGFFALFIFSGIIGSLNARSTRMRLFGGLLVNPLFLLIMGGVFTAQMVMIYYGGELFGMVPLSGRELRYVLILASTVVPVGRVYELVRRMRKLPRPMREERMKMKIGK